MSDPADFHDRAYILGDAVMGIAEALQRDTDNDQGVRLGAALEVIGEEVARLAADMEEARRSAPRAAVIEPVIVPKKTAKKAVK